MLLETIRSRTDALAVGDFFEAARLSIELYSLLDQDDTLEKYENSQELLLIIDSINAYQRYKDSIPIAELASIEGMCDVLLDAVLPQSWSFTSDVIVIDSSLFDEEEFKIYFEKIEQKRFFFIRLADWRDQDHKHDESASSFIVKAIGSLLPNRIAVLLNKNCNFSVKFEKDLRESIARLKMLRNTVSHFEEKWLDNIIEGIPYFQSSHCASFLKNHIKGKEVLVISPGPSLMKCRAELNSIRSNFIFLAVAQSVPALNEIGITPDFVMVVDPVNYSNVLHGLNFESCKGLIAYEGIHNSFFSAGFRHVFLISPPSSPIMNYDLIGGSSIVLAGSSVSVQACALAIGLGAKTVALVGQDLCLQDGRQYSAESDDKKSLGNGEIIQDIQGALYLKSKLDDSIRSLHVVKGQNDEVLLSPSDYFMYLIELQQLASKVHEELDVRLINFSRGGAQIDGFENYDMGLYPTVPLDFGSIEYYSDGNYKQKLLRLSDTCIDGNYKFTNIYPEIRSDDAALVEAFLAIPLIRCFGKRRLVQFFNGFENIISEESLYNNKLGLESSMRGALKAHLEFFMAVHKKIYSL